METEYTPAAKRSGVLHVAVKPARSGAKGSGSDGAAARSQANRDGHVLEENRRLGWQRWVMWLLDGGLPEDLRALLRREHVVALYAKYGNAMGEPSDEEAAASLGWPRSTFGDRRRAAELRLGLLVRYMDAMNHRAAHRKLAAPYPALNQRVVAGVVLPFTSWKAFGELPLTDRERAALEKVGQLLRDARKKSRP